MPICQTNVHFLENPSTLRSTIEEKVLTGANRENREKYDSGFQFPSLIPLLAPVSFLPPVFSVTFSPFWENPPIEALQKSDSRRPENIFLDGPLYEIRKLKSEIRKPKEPG
jgi:hypothetical protein